MPENRTITQDKFDALLVWLDPDRAKAGMKYEEIRRTLVDIFVWRGFGDAEGLADETIDRVMRKVSGLAATYVGDPALYFYSVAKRLIYEEQRRLKIHHPLDDLNTLPGPAPEEEQTKEEVSELEHECLKRCMQRLSPEQREMLVSYYMKEKHAKIDHRRELAARLGIEINTLRVRMYRLRSALQACIKNCLKESAPAEMD